MGVVDVSVEDLGDHDILWFSSPDQPKDKVLMYGYAVALQHWLGVG